MERALRSEVESLKDKLQSQGYGLRSTATDTAHNNQITETVRMECISIALTCNSSVLTYDTLCSPPSLRTLMSTLPYPILSYPI